MLEIEKRTKQPFQKLQIDSARLSKDKRKARSLTLQVGVGIILFASALSLIFSTDLMSETPLFSLSLAIGSVLSSYLLIYGGGDKEAPWIVNAGLVIGVILFVMGLVAFVPFWLGDIF